jgi:transglutaminase-like putative cysteine protease
MACCAQENGFPYGKATYRELEITEYATDTAAAALVLDEFGEAFINNEFNLQYTYHARIKILKTEGVRQGTFEILLRKSEGRAEKIIAVKASSYNVENGSMRESKLEPKSVYSENHNKFYNIQKFAIPNAKVGSVIEVLYTLESPFIYNFRSWEFQSDIPKLKSEYLCIIPGIYHYNISLRGFMKLSKNESELVKSCFTPAGRSADCGRMLFGMKDIPAFKEEEFMIARSNFLSAINFELSQINYFDGRKDKITKEWKDVDEELRQHSEFGVQIKRGKDLLDRQIEQIIAGETDDMAKAQKIYDFIKGWYRWNDVYGKYSEFGIKKAFDAKVGNVGDINLSLIAALKYAGITVEPLLLSTRENGLPTEVYPVMSDFNYVVAKATIANKFYLLDATDDFYPFGLLPERCLNGKGRVIGAKESYWQDLVPSERQRVTSLVNLNLSNEGMSGSVQYTYSGYAAVNERKKIKKFSSEQEYINSITNRLHDITITKFSLENVDNLDKPLVVLLDVDLEVGDLLGGGTFLFSPFIVDQWKRNPFRSTERLYPVDFGAPLEEILILNLTYPSDFELDEIPAKVALKLPANGGHFIFEVNDASNKLSMANTLVIAKPIFTSQEYHYLKELFNNVIATEQTQLVFKKKK